MKLFTLLFIFSLAVNADEIQRIESIVDDISKLRESYEVAQEQLQECRSTLNDIKINDNNKYLVEIQSLKKEIQNLKNRLKNKKNCENSNKFPKLTMKKKSKKEVILSDVIYFKASAFKLDKKSDIFSSIDGEKIEEWDRGSSFTSNQKKDGYIKITGYFVNRQWKKSQKERWIKESDISIKSKKNN